MDERRGRQVGDELRQRPVDGREELQQLAEARDGVVGGQELGEDVAAADARRRRRRRPPRPPCVRSASVAGVRITSRSLPSTSWSTRLVTVIGNASLPAAAVRADQAQVEQQRLVDGNLLRLLVDEVDALGGAVEDDAHLRADGAHEVLRLADRLVQRRHASACAARP